MDQESWYEEIEAGEGLLQGDFILGCPSLALPDNLDEIGSYEFEVEVEVHNAIIVTQSCDLDSKGTNTILLCPYYPLKQWLERSKDYQAVAKAGGNTDKLVKSEFDKLRKGNYVAFHLLNRDESVGLEDFQVVELGSSFSVKRTVIDALLKKNGNRIRVKSPYREHLSQAFATYFMRVALPNDRLSISDLGYYRPTKSTS